MPYQTITSAEEFREFCRRLADARSIAFDTEFVSEFTYRPVLCLVQVAVDEQLTVIDPLSVGDMTPFWSVLAEEGHETIVHAGRQELEFCLQATGRMPARLFDVQIAAGLIGLEYPASYATLVRKLLGETPQKGETRTDWRRRPLSRGQLEYALVDVEHLHQLQAGLRERLARLDRTAWFTSEMEAWQNEVAGARANDRWRRVAGSSGLPARGLAVVRELWAWREAEAERRDWPVRRVLRDDLITELAKRRSSEPKQIRAIRGMERGDLARSIGDLAKAIERALKLPDADCPRVVRTDTNSQLTMLGQFLTSALSSICRAAQVAPSIVGTATDVRELVAYRLKEGNGDPNQLPILAQGWRAEVVGQMLDDLLAGEKVIRIRNPRSDEPLEIVPRGRP